MKLRTQLVVGYALMFAIIVGLATITHYALKSLMDTSDWVAHTQKVLRMANLVERQLVDMETGQRGFLITGQDEFLEPYENAVQAYSQMISDLKLLVSDNAEQVRRLEAIEKRVVDWQEQAMAPAIEIRKSVGDGAVEKEDDAVDRLATSQIDEAAAPEIAARRETNKREASMKDIVALLKKGTGKAIMDDLRKRFYEFTGVERELLDVRGTEAKRNVRLALLMTIGSAALGIVIGIVAMAVIIRGVMQQVGGEPAAIAEIANQIASGDLALRMDAGSRDTTGILAAIQSMALNLQNQTGEIRGAAGVIATASSESASMITQVTASTAETATAVNETTSTVEELKQAAQVNSQKAKTVSEGASRAADIAQCGIAGMDRVAEEMQRIKTQMQAIGESVMDLSEQTQAVDEIIGTVDDLAEQSNLLAVNAAIEAAKAGEQGKGFAVVAQEIKSLAEQSKDATKRVRTILSDIQKANSTTVLATEAGGKAVEAGGRSSEEARTAIATMSEQTQSASEAATQIAASSHQQTVGVDQVASAMENIREAANQNVDSMKQLEQATRTLNELGVKLQGLMDRYTM